MAEEKDNLHHFDRVNADKSIGLTQAEVDVRVANGAVNKSKIHVEKSFGKKDYISDEKHFQQMI